MQGVEGGAGKHAYDGSKCCYCYKAVLGGSVSGGGENGRETVRNGIVMGGMMLYWQ